MSAHPSHKEFNTDGFCLACGMHRERAEGIEEPCAERRSAFYVEQPKYGDEPVRKIEQERADAEFAQFKNLIEQHDLAFRYAVRAALGMNDKCGLTGLEKDVAEVHGIATNLRDVLTAVLPLLENCNGSRGWGIEADRLTKRVRAALADAQFPRLWG